MCSRTETAFFSGSPAAAGRAFIDLYYHYGPRLAEGIVARPWLRTTVRWSLVRPAALAARLWRGEAGGMESSLAGLGLALAAGLAGYGLRRRRRRLDRSGLCR